MRVRGEGWVGHGVTHHPYSSGSEQSLNNLITFDETHIDLLNGTLTIFWCERMFMNIFKSELDYE